MLEMRETYENETDGHVFGETEWYEPFTEDRGKLFRSLQQEYGRCVSKMYRDVTGGPPATVGWVFSRRERYEDSNDRYTRVVWVELRDNRREAELDRLAGL